ncbi:MAG: DUF359 domain-containing protein [Thermoplasmatales archaeon]|jgi:uncharacterized protein (UPF0218 family)|nr:MAG: DUF359 domain-containing protein [Thermoplasmatales archaeon]
MYILPDELRDLLNTPIGTLLNEKQLLKKISDKDLIVAVGDQVTYTLLKNNVEPIFCIVDYKTRRGKFPSSFIQLIKSYGNKVIKVENPQGRITDELWHAIEKAFSNAADGIFTRIEVDGEEDLASLPVIFMAPRDVTIIYGLPDKGVLVVKPTDENKQKVKEVLNKM